MRTEKMGLPLLDPLHPFSIFLWDYVRFYGVNLVEKQVCFPDVSCRGSGRGNLVSNLNRGDGNDAKAVLPADPLLRTMIV